jgi:hypothetical protein
MKIAELITLPLEQKVVELLRLPRIYPEIGRNILYHIEYWDGMHSGTLLWNGALLYFKLVFDEFDDYPAISHDRDDVDEPFEYTYESTRRWFAVCLYSDAHMLQDLRRHVSFRRNVNPDDYRNKMKNRDRNKMMSRIGPNYQSWYSRKWPQIPSEPYDGTVIAWFAI